MKPRKPSKKAAMAVSNADCGQVRQPQRGCLFIVGHALNTPSFCFSAAHDRRREIDRYIAATLRRRSHSRLLAPLKNKKNKGLGAALAINRPPRWGGSTEDAQNLSEVENRWIEPSSAF
jgi:hypothetical protein